MDKLNLNDFDLMEITNIEECDEEDTIDICLEKHHYFFANDIYSHNSGLSSNTVQMEQTSEALNKNFGSYLTLGLARTQEDKNKNTGRLSVCKNRNGPDGMTFNIFMDPSNVDIRILGDFDPRKDISSLVDVEEQKRRMRAKYKKYKENNGGIV